MARLWYLSWEDFGKYSRQLSGKVMKSSKKFDLVVAIARGGLPVGLVVADQLDLKIDFVNVKSYSGIYKKTKPHLLSTLRGSIKGKSILLVDDLIDNGSTMRFMLGYLRKKGVANVNTAALFKKPWSKLTPDFCIKTVDEWVVFPWNSGETKRLQQRGISKR
jgi:uncharacterized protein